MATVKATWTQVRFEDGEAWRGKIGTHEIIWSRRVTFSTVTWSGTDKKRAYSSEDGRYVVLSTDGEIIGSGYAHEMAAAISRAEEDIENHAKKVKIARYCIERRKELIAQDADDETTQRELLETYERIESHVS